MTDWGCCPRGEWDGVLRWCDCPTERSLTWPLAPSSEILGVNCMPWPGSPATEGDDAQTEPALDALPMFMDAPGVAGCTLKSSNRSKLSAQELKVVSYVQNIQICKCDVWSFLHYCKFHHSLTDSVQRWACMIMNHEGTN